MMSERSNRVNFHDQKIVQEKLTLQYFLSTSYLCTQNIILTPQVNFKYIPQLLMKFNENQTLNYNYSQSENTMVTKNLII